jgi:DNA-directed RNA polymerase specialized sigma24 family protein
MRTTPPYGLNTFKEKSAYWFRKQADNPAALQEALALLPPDMATVLRLHYVDQVSIKDIGAYIRKSISTVRHHLHRGIFLVFHYLEYQELP